MPKHHRDSPQPLDIETFCMRAVAFRDVSIGETIQFKRWVRIQTHLPESGTYMDWLNTFLQWTPTL